MSTLNNPPTTLPLPLLAASTQVFPAAPFQHSDVWYVRSLNVATEHLDMVRARSGARARCIQTPWLLPRLCGRATPRSTPVPVPDPCVAFSTLFPTSIA